MELVTAGESHGPALVAIVSGLPAGLVLDRAAIDADLARRQAGYGRSPRQRIERDSVTLPRPGHADLAGVMKYGLADARDALERASARHTASTVVAGAVEKALLRAIGVDVEGSVVEIGGEREDVEAAIDAAPGDRDTLGGVV